MSAAALRFEDLVHSSQEWSAKEDLITHFCGLMVHPKFPRDVWDVLEEERDQLRAETAKAYELVGDTAELGAGFDAAGAELEAVFSEQASAWKWDTAASSSLTNVALHPSYQRIIGLGPRVLPLIFRDLQESGDPWYWALRALTGENPVPPEHRGHVAQMTEDWLDWGRQHGYL